MENEECYYNIIIVGDFEEIDKILILNLFGNPIKSDLIINNENICIQNIIECYSRQINEQIFKGIRIIFFIDFDLNIEYKNNLFEKLMEELNRKGLICFYLSENEKINLFNTIISYDIVSYDHPLFTFIENEEEENKLIEMKKILFQKIKQPSKKKNAIYSKRIKFINKKYLIYKLLRDYHIFNYIDNKDIIIQFDLQYLKDEHTINLMLVGRKRSGKSSLVNLLLGEEVAYADSGNSVTTGIREYIHKKYNLSIFDTVGFDKGDGKNIDENVDNVIKSVKNFCEENQIGYKKKIHLFLFCINRASGFIDNDDKKFLEFLINENENKNNKIMIIFTYVPSKSEKKNTKKKFEQELIKLLINAEKKNELKENTVYLDLFESSTKDFEEFLEKIFKILEPEIDKLKEDKKNIKNTIFWGKTEKTENIKKRVLKSMTKYKNLSILSAYIPLPGFDILSEYKVREYMFDKIAKEYKELLEDKIPDNYKDPDVRKIVAKASKYTYLRKDGTFYPKKRYEDIYEKLKQNHDPNSDDKSIQNEQNIIDTDNKSVTKLDKENFNDSYENEKNHLFNLLFDDAKINEINDIEEVIKMKENFEKNYFEKEKGIKDIQQTNCSKIKGAGNIVNSTLKSGSTLGGIGIHIGIKGVEEVIVKDGGKEVIKNVIKIGGKELSKKLFTFGIPIIGEIVCGSIFGAINYSSIKKKIKKIIKEIDESLTGNENIESLIAEKLIENFNSLKNDYFKEFSKNGNDYDIDFNSLEDSGKLMN